MRKLILASTVSFLMSPLSSWALGLGDIKVNSVLNEPLSAEIDVYSATNKDLDSLNVQLASKLAFARADIERSGFLNQLRFTLLTRKDGTPYIQVTTKRSFREPFVNFLVEANWQSGRLMREYTLLVDPPELVRSRARPVSTARIQKTAQVQRTTPAPRKSSPSVSTSNNNVSYASSGEELSYGPTQRNDTLYSIAQQMAPSGVSVDQMMMALLRDNPEAFVDNNINNLKAGYVLRIKDIAVLNQLDRATAARQVREQYSAWKQTRQQQTSNANLVDRGSREETEVKHDGKLTLLAEGATDKASATGKEEGQSAEQLQQKLLLANEEIESKSLENQELQARIKELEELLETKASILALKDEGLATLQQQQQLKQVGDEGVAEELTAEGELVEEGLSEETVAESEASETSTVNTTETAPEAADVAAAETIADLSVQSEPLSEHIDPSALLAQLEASVQGEVSIDLEGHIDPSVLLAEEELSTAESQPVEVSETAQQLASNETSITSQAPSTAETTQIAAPVVTDSQTQKTKELTTTRNETDKQVGKSVKSQPETQVEESGSILPYVGGAAALLALLAGVGIVRSRRKEPMDFEESILESEETNLADDSFNIEQPQSAEATRETEVSEQETSFLSDFSADDMETLQPDDVEADPIAEADVFIVYGRFQQAEELLKSAIENEPSRLDYQMKLLEVYQGNDQKDAFVEQAKVIKALLQETSNEFESTPEWRKIETWAEKLAIVLPVATAEGTIVPEQDDISDMEAIEKDLALTEQDSSNDELTLEVDTEFTLDDIEDSTQEVAETGIAEENSEKDNVVEFELNDDLSSDQEDISAQQSATLDLEDNGEKSEDETALDFGEVTLELEDIEDEINEAADLALETEKEDSLEHDNSLELDLDMDESISSDTSADQELSLEELDNEPDVDDSGFEPVDTETHVSDDKLELSDKEPVVEDESELDISDLDQEFPELDAIGTKLDLARAYIDMGDLESASSILNEVMNEGNDEQKSQAESLLNQAKLAG